jgi:hypothetical protein
MRQTDQLLDEISRLPHFRCGAGATPEEVRNVESALGVVLPEDYRKFLRKFGYARWLGTQVFGVFEQASKAEVRKDGFDYDCIRNTLAAPQEFLPPGAPPLPPGGVVISEDGSGAGVILLFGGREKGGGRVAYYNFEDGEEPVQEWPTFTDYLAKLVEDTRAHMARR